MPKKFVFFILFVLIAFFAVSNFLILQDMFHPLGKDWHAHLKHSSRIIKEVKLSSFLFHPITAYRDFIMLDQDYPPLYHAIAAVVFSLMGANLMFMTSTLFLIILIFATYKIGKLLKNESAGLFSAVVVSLYPIIYLSSRDFNLELAQAAVVTLILYLLMRSDNFKKIKYSFLFGLFFAAGMLIKQQVFLFIIGPLLVTLITALINSKKTKIPLLNIILFIVPFSLITFYLFYYIYLNGDVLKHFFLRTNSTSELEISSVNWFNWSHVLFYLRSLRLYQIGLVNILLALVFAPPFYLKKEYSAYRVFFTCWLVVPVIWLSFIPTKYNEYTIACLPVLALITGLGISSMRNLFARRCLTIVFLGFNLFLFLDLVSPGKNTSIIAGKNKIGIVLNELKVYRTPASTYGVYNSCILKSLNADYKATRYLEQAFADKDGKIGVVSYVNFTGFLPATEFELLFPLYDKRHEVKNLIFNPLANDPDEFDALIFVSDPARKGEQWINKDYLIKKLTDYNDYQHKQAANKKISERDKDLVLGFYFVQDSPFSKRPAPNYCTVETAKIDEVARYYPKLKLIREIDGMGRPDILIYKKME